MMNLIALRILLMLSCLAFFLFIVGWAWSASRREPFAAAARLPLEDDALDSASGATEVEP